MSRKVLDLRDYETEESKAKRIAQAKAETKIAREKARTEWFKKHIFNLIATVIALAALVVAVVK